MLTMFTVNSLLDNGDGANTTLREAIEQAQNTPGPDTIEFSTDPAHGLNGGTILLTQGDGTAALSISESVTIDATMLPLGITIDASPIDPTPTVNDGLGVRVFQIFARLHNDTSLDVTLAGLTITGGDPFVGAGGIAYASQLSGDLTIRDCTIRDNFGYGGGGISADISNALGTPGIRIEHSVISGNELLRNIGQPHNAGAGLSVSVSGGAVDIVDTTISGNIASGSGSNGGGVYGRLSNGSKMTIDRSTISGNTADTKGGGFFVLLAGTANDTIVLSNSTVSGNHALHEVGGGGYVCQKFGGKFEATNSTISGNEALDASNGRGGGLCIAREGTAPAVNSYLNHLTITNNRATSGGGLFSANDPLVHTSVNNTIISGNFNALGPPNHNNVGGKIEVGSSSKYNFFGSGGSASFTGLDITNILNNNDPMLGPLVNNGGPEFLDGSRMLTHALLPNSMAVNKGDPSIAFSLTEFDQRGEPWYRKQGLRIDIGAFERQANPLIGDYNFNGVVDAADYTVWRSTLGSTIDLRADGNGNGMIDQGDYNVWKIGFGDVIADFDGSGATDIADYILWTATEGSTTDLRADCNGDGIVDEADFQIWFDTFGSTLAIAQFGLLSSMFDPDAPPAVVGVTLGFSGVAAVDFAGRVGSGEQIRSVPLVAANTLNITFSRDVNVAYADLQIVNLDGSSPTIFDFDYDSLSQTATWTFTTSLADGRYVIRLADAVEDLNGKALDGEFFNPVTLSDAGTATFPSGDGDEGGEFRFRFTVLAGDSDHNNIHGAANYQNWQSIEPGMIIVSTTADDYDSDLSFGDVSLREAVNYANLAGVPIAIQLPAGRYTLTRTGTESSANVGVNDLDITGNISILGAGPGVSIIDNSGLASAPQARAFEQSGSASWLRLSRLTVANGSSSQSGQVATMTAGATLEIIESAIVNHTAYAGAAAVLVNSANLVVTRSVFTNNDNTSIYGGTAILVSGTASAPSSLSVGESIFALNSQPLWDGSQAHRAIWITGTTTKTNRGKNLYDYAGGGFFDTTPGAGDYLGTPQFVVTSVADTFNHADDLEALSLREAVDLANQASGPQTIWLPAWRFVLTCDRGTNATDTSVAYGDLDVKNSMTLRGVEGRTSVGWKSGVVDKVFDLIGDFNNDGQADYGTVSSADYTLWQNQNGSSGAWEQFSADADDDGDVDADDYNLWNANYGHALTLAEIAL